MIYYTLVDEQGNKACELYSNPNDHRLQRIAKLSEGLGMKTYVRSYSVED